MLLLPQKLEGPTPQLVKIEAAGTSAKTITQEVFGFAKVGHLVPPVPEAVTFVPEHMVIHVFAGSPDRVDHAV